MESKEITRLDLAKGATIFKQGHYETLGFTPRNAEGEVVDLTGKDINVVIVKGRSIVYDVAGTYDSVSNTIQFVIAENIGYGDMWMEITVTDPKDASYRQKFPTSEYDGKLKFIRSADDVDFVGFSGKTVAKFEEDQKVFKGEVNTEISTIHQRIEEGIGAFTEDTEVLDARMGEPNLRSNLVKVNRQLEETEKKAVSTVSHDVDTNVIVSFQDDDGNKKVMSILKPIFEAAGVPMTVGIITNRLKQADSVTEDDLRTLKNLDWTVCSHTHTHPYLATLDESGNEYEIKTAKEKLNQLGMDGDIIIYPYGSHSEITDKVARKHSVLGVGGYDLYNTMPIITYGLNRFTHISENTFDLAACKAVIDNATPNSWIIFYTHVNYDMWLLPETVQKMKDLIAYIKSKGIDIVNTREGLKRKGNILDAGTRNDKRVKIGRDGSYEFVNFDKKDFTSSTPVPYFPEGETTVYLNSNEMVGKGFPVTTASLITTYRSPSKDTTKEVSSYQEIKPYTNNEVLRRRWLTDTNTWGAFEKVQQNMEAYPMHRLATGRSPYGGSSAVSSFPVNSITTNYFDNLNNVGMPISAGYMTTYRISGNGLDRQEVRGYNSNRMWSRIVNLDGTWGEFEEIQTELFAWAGFLDINTAFKQVGKTRLKNFLYIEKIHSVGPTQPVLVKDVWQFNEISTDSTSPTTVATLGAINMVAYQDAKGSVFIKNGASGGNHRMFFKTSFA